MSAFEFVLAGAPEAKAWAFPSQRFTIGSGPQAGLRFEPTLVQPVHAEVAIDAKGVPWIRDLTNQSLLWVNDAQVAKSALAVGSRLRLGRLELLVRQVGQSEVRLEATARRPTPFTSPPIEATAKRPTPFASPPVSLDSTAKRPTPFRSMPVGAKASGGNWKPVLTASPVTPMETGDEATRRSAIPTAPEAEPVGAQAPADGRTVLPEGALIAGRYRIIKKLAAGGMGEVYQAEHIELHKQFAVKVMLPALSSDQEFVNRFKREAISASRIGQLNIIDISDFGQTEDEGRFYFVMEFLDGVTIASLLHREGKMPLLRMVNVALQTARALAAAHAQGIVHRDMKPENVMVLQRPGQPDFVKVLDFGVAKVSKGPGEGGQTQLGMVVGTPQYMSPEQAMGVAVDARTDTYALGLIFYEMLTGTPTYQGDTASILMVKQVTEPAPPFPEALAATLPAALNDLIFQMLEKDPKNRPETMDKVVEVLENLQAHLRVGAKLAPATASGRFPTTATPHSLSPVRVTSSGLPVAPVPRPSGSVPAIAAPATAAAAPAATLSTGTQEAVALPPTSKLPMALGGALVLVLLAGGGFMAFKPSDPPRPEPIVTPPVVTPPPLEKIEKVEPVVVTPKSFLVKLTSTPEGAQIFKGESLVGVTPFEVQLEKGSVLELELSLAGYAKEKVKLEPIGDLALNLPLKKLSTVAKPAGKPGDKPADKPGDKPNPLLTNPYGEPVKDLQEDPY
ncbi:MAG: protein kinase [Archangium sp.]|nr:protein kinase [Archangium sp.]